MTVERKWWSVAPAAVLMAALAGCGGAQAGEASASAGPGAEIGRRITVEVETLAPTAFTDYVRLTGTVEADRDVTVAAEESGVIRELYVEKGARVAAGQPIAKIDDRVLAAQAEQAAAEAALAKETWERQRRLWEEERIGTEIAYLRARYAAETADANARALAARLERTTIRAPVSGILDARFVEIGNMVAPGTPVARVVDSDPVKVVGGVPERFAGDVRRGGAVRITFDVLQGREFEGRIAFVGTVVDAQSRTFPIEVEVPNPGGDIKPGMVANISATRRAFDSVIAVPRDAVVRTEGGYIAYVAVEQGGRTIAEARPLQLGPAQMNRIVVESGLQAGDRLIVVGQQQVAAGDILEVVAREGRAP